MTAEYIVRLARSGGIKPISNLNEDDIIDYINLGVLELYKRFNLKTKEVLIAREENKLIYSLPDDCMYVQGAWGNSELSINDEEEPDSLFTVSPFEVMIPNTVAAPVISVVYAASPSRIISIEDNIEVPSSCLEALLHYIAFSAKSAIDASTNAENNAHWLRFEASCKNILLYGLVHPNDTHRLGVRNVYV